MSLTSGRWSMVLTGEEGEVIEAGNLDLTIMTEHGYETDVLYNIERHRTTGRQVTFTLHQYQGEVKLTLPKPKVKVGSKVTHHGCGYYTVRHIQEEYAMVQDPSGRCVVWTIDTLEVVQ